MATSEEHKELIEDIKRPIRHYRVTIWGYGGEGAYLKLTRDQYDFWRAKDEEEYDTTLNYILDCEDNGAPSNIPKEMDFMRCVEVDYDDEKVETVFYPAWHDAPNIVLHQHGADWSSARISIDELDGEGPSSNIIASIVTSVDLSDWHEVAPDSEEPVVSDYVKEEEPDYVLHFYSAEKGIFFDGFLTTTGPINLNKLQIITTEQWNGDETVDGIKYNGEDIENWGCDTNGKGYSVHLWSNV